MEKAGAKRIENTEELAQEAERFIATLRPSRAATLVTLSGELGAGKTTFTQAVAKALGVDEHVTSPTFVLEKIYELPNAKAYARLVHIDAYRLDSGTALKNLGFAELCYDPANLILLEWPEKVADALPPPSVSITLAPNPDGSRMISYG